ncbi:MULTISPECIES: hypothetical protein [Levilactobacillus]|uniref:hypothetical protein n=2 Tax=Lactobacillaceae TaxID=33958 RepID=UPI001EF2F923|nr:hypothetical protein [Levilactobacillus sp. 244-2]
MSKICDPKTVHSFLMTIKHRRSQWRLSYRQKNLLTLSQLGLGATPVLDIINRQLTWQDYISGPLADNHQPPIPGAIWIFGLTILKQPCYLKFQDRPDGIVMWISLHIAEFNLKFPYQNSKEVF